MDRETDVKDRRTKPHYPIHRNVNEWYEKVTALSIAILYWYIRIDETLGWILNQNDIQKR